MEKGTEGRVRGTGGGGETGLFSSEFVVFILIKLAIGNSRCTH